MGNSQETQPNPIINRPLNTQKLYSHRFSELSNVSSNRNSIEGANQLNHCDQHRRNLSLKTSLANNRNNSKSRKFLSLSKNQNSLNRSMIKVDHSVSKDKRGIKITADQNFITKYQKPMSHNSVPQIRFDERHNVKYLPIRPKDLPRKCSIQRIIVPQYKMEAPYIAKRRVPQPQIMVRAVNMNKGPCFRINYANKLENNQLNNSLQTSIVTPFVPMNFTTEIPFPNCSEKQLKKLKRVIINRGSNNNIVANTNHINENNQEQEQNNKQNQNHKLKREQPRYSLSVDMNINPQGYQNLFTDPNLYAYITNNKKHPCINQKELKYALPSPKYEVPFSNQLIMDLSMMKKSSTLYKYALSSPKINIINLEDAAHEVQSKPLIEEDDYRFPTITDISEDFKSENTSFTPIANHKNNYKLEGEQLLKFCKPEIDERVLAALRKFPS